MWKQIEHGRLWVVEPLGVTRVDGRYIKKNKINQILKSSSKKKKPGLMHALGAKDLWPRFPGQKVSSSESVFWSSDRLFRSRPSSKSFARQVNLE
jgi:hypothetical protein